MISEISSQSKTKVPEIFELIENQIKRCNPLLLISILSNYSLTTMAGDDGVESNEETDRINQSQVELLQALILNVPKEEIGSEPVTPNTVGDLGEHLKDVSRYFSFSRLSSETLHSSSEDSAVVRVQELLRSHTQTVRNWGYHYQIVTISKEIFGYFDDVFRAKYGFSCTEAMDIFQALADMISERTNERFNALQALHSIKKPNEMVLKYHEMIGLSEQDAIHFYDELNIRKLSHRRVFGLLLSHYDLRMDEIYKFEPSSVAEKLSIHESVVQSCMDYFSYLIGDLKSNQKLHFFLDNPIWAKPVVSTSDGYYCFLPQVFFSFILTTMGEMVESIDRVALSKQRSSYLENKIEEIVKRRFPSSQISSGFKWESGDTVYETDLIVVIDTFAVIVEAKSQKISKPALRGAPDRIRKHLNDILIQPGLQSRRFELKLNELKELGWPDDQLLDSLGIDVKKVNRILRLSVSLEDFATLQTNFRLFGETGWIPEDFVPCPSINLADFETLFDYLEHPVHIIHYILRRTEFDGKFHFFGDELDLMGFYLDTLFNVEGLGRAEEMEMYLTGMSKPLDNYYISRDEGIQIAKPQPKITPFFKKILTQLERRGTPRWVEIGCILNRFAPVEQRKLFQAVKDLTKVVHKRWEEKEHRNMTIYSPPEASEYAIAVVLFKNGNAHKRREYIDHAAKLGLGPEHVKYCLVLGINIDDEALAYHSILLAEKERGETD